MKYPTKHGEQNERIRARMSAEHKWPKRDHANKYTEKHSEVENEIARRAQAVHQPGLMKGRKRRHRNLTDVTPPPELGDNLNA